MKTVFQCFSTINFKNIFCTILLFSSIFLRRITVTSTKNHHHCRHHHQEDQTIIDYLPLSLPFFQTDTDTDDAKRQGGGSSLRAEDAQLVETLNQQLVTTINGAHILVAYLDADLLQKLSLAELTEEMTFLTDAYLTPALETLDDTTFHANLLHLLPSIANDTAKMERLFSSLSQYLPPYSNILKALLTKSTTSSSSGVHNAMNNTAKNASKSYNTSFTELSSSDFTDFVATSIVLETGFEYLFHLLTLYSKLLQVPVSEMGGSVNQSGTSSSSSWWHSTMVSYPLANTEGVLDLLNDLLHPLNDLAEKNFSSRQCTTKLVRKVGDSLKLIKSRLRYLKLSSTKTTAVSLLEKIETIEKKLLLKPKSKNLK